jgi:hypothetical protein
VFEHAPELPLRTDLRVSNGSAAGEARVGSRSNCVRSSPSGSCALGASSVPSVNDAVVDAPKPMRALASTVLRSAAECSRAPAVARCCAPIRPPMRPMCHAQRRTPAAYRPPRSRGRIEASRRIHVIGEHLEDAARRVPVQHGERTAQHFDPAANGKGRCDTCPCPSGIVAGTPSRYRRTPRMPKLARVPKPRIEICSSCA